MPDKFDQFAQYAVDPDRTVAVTDYELRQLAARLSEDDALPVSTRGEVFVLMPGTHTLEPLIQLCRMREAVTRPTAQEPQSDAQAADQAQEPATPDALLSRLADDMQNTVERALGNMEVDPVKFDHQNRAGDLVGALLAVLRRHALLVLTPEADRVLNGPSGGRSLRHAARDGYLSQRDRVVRAVGRGLSSPGFPIDRVMEELDGVLGR